MIETMLTERWAQKSTGIVLMRLCLVVFLVYLLICAVGLVGGGFKLAAGEHAKSLFEFASNPLAGLMIGTIATALIQSSSTVTSIIVGLVAGGLPVSVAVPIVMGANIGTSITNTIVSLGHFRNSREFQRAFAAATVHDIFNVLIVIIFLPLEIAFGLLEKVGSVLSAHFYNTGDASIGSINFIKFATSPVVNGAKEMLIGFGDQVGGLILIVLGVSFIFVSISLIGSLLKAIMVGRAKGIIHSAIGRNPATGITSGALVTVLFQSSSSTTSLIVPLAGSGMFSLKQIYPFTLGANIGTCITAVLAATAVTGNSEAALQIAFIHFSYNVLGVILIFGLPFLRYLPVVMAQSLGDLACRSRFIPFVYLAGVFIFVPFAFLLISRFF